MLLMMGVCTRNMSSYEYINKITLLHQVGISSYFIWLSDVCTEDLVREGVEVPEAMRQTCLDQYL